MHVWLVRQARKGRGKVGGGRVARGSGHGPAAGDLEDQVKTRGNIAAGGDVRHGHDTGERRAAAREAAWIVGFGGDGRGMEATGRLTARSGGGSGASLAAIHGGGGRQRWW